MAIWIPSNFNVLIKIIHIHKKNVLGKIQLIILIFNIMFMKIYLFPVFSILKSKDKRNISPCLVGLQLVWTSLFLCVNYGIKTIPIVQIYLSST